ncbi:MAG TPA: hypothetical protein VNJ53_12860 [Gaiellaceae bacterium]|nr:hypothetical protein [Gaiellaceae bacterium]
MRPGLVVAAGLLAALLATGARAAPSEATFTDPAGDQRNTERLVAPDITSVHVSNTRAGLITFRVTIPSHAELPPRSRVAVLFDLDREIATGDAGFEYAVSHSVDAGGQTSVRFERWEEALLQLVEIPATSLASTFADGVYVLSVPRSELGNTIGFAFGLYAALFDPDPRQRTAVDDAPNANLWAYDLVGLPAPRLSASRVSVLPARPAAGRPVTVSSVVVRLDTRMPVTRGSVTCSARAGTLRIPARGSFRGEQARCTLRVPRSAKGKRVTGILTVRAHGAVVSKRFAFRVR